MSEQQAAAKLTPEQKINLLAAKLVFALKYARFPGAGLMAYGFKEGGPVRMVHWTDDFCNALGQCGILIDREALEQIRRPSRGKKAKGGAA